MKKFLIFLCACLLLVGCNSKKEENVVNQPVDDTEIKLIMELDSYKDLKLEDIVSYEEIRFVYAGDIRKTYTDRETIESVYNMLSEVKIKNTTGASCEDNTTVHKFTVKDGTTYSFEFECGVFVYGRFRYEVVR
ncbi:MAG: hypothetical protein IKO78_03235 [Bacilli bacterium]|nr:hypothetical protein [Bacilli bacterium]